MLIRRPVKNVSSIRAEPGSRKLATYSSHCPEKIRIGSRIDGTKLAIRSHNFHLQNLICTKAKLATDRTVTSSSDPPPNTNRYIAATDYGNVVLYGFDVYLKHIHASRNLDRSDSTKSDSPSVVFLDFNAPDIVGPD
jgi:hypothetical protein